MINTSPNIICKFKECRLPTRWCFAECIKKEIHRHDMEYGKLITHHELD